MYDAPMAVDSRVAQILERIMTMARGDLVTKLDPSEAQDELDAIMTGLNLLAEELAHSRHEQRLLQGMLPICSLCKNVRDDKGYWMRIEKYIQERTDAVFTHGLCNDCSVAHYGEDLTEGDE
jgi:hypothetical protein